MKYLFIGPTLLAGIGQVTRQYSERVKSLGHESVYVPFGDPVPKGTFDMGFAFVLPIEQHLHVVDSMLSACKKKMYMTICETETVHPVYEILVKRYKTLWTPSQFCLDVFSKQFPHGNWRLLHLWAPTPQLVTPVKEDAPYTFYTIGNMLDPRKNISMLLEAFGRLQLPNARLLLKATCKVPVNWKIPGVVVINGLLSDEDLEKYIHGRGHCYINCSHSEGVGMGAVEAALRGKPVIITDFGGLKEYVPDTPFIVKCTRAAIEQDDFLFQKGMIWGQPSIDDLVKHMKTCYDQRIVTWDHPNTHTLINSITFDEAQVS
ncbi:glycosyltransferase family 1 protein [bacterium]|jgi:glycosyltransferase involved in cell wall biosynthesis|nr:glycosyltransferase family 1 protein [bacterium]